MFQLLRRGPLTAALLALLVLLLAAPVTFAKDPVRENPYDDSLPVWMTAEELTRVHEIGTYQQPTAAPPGPARNPGEFEPMTGIIVRYPFGNPTDLLAEYSQDTELWVIVTSASQSTASSALSSAGANMSNVNFFNATTDSYWTRDYGPWFIINGNDEQGIVDHDYNRPRPNDDLIPSLLASSWGVPAYVMDLETAGGNYMSDGRGVAMCSELTLDENSGMTEQQIDDMVEDYLGVTRYEKLGYVQTGGIHHIDCSAKFLAPDKILYKQVDPGHSDYARIEANITYLSQIQSSYGTPYEIIRVYTPNDEPYTNSLIVNNKVYVPMYGTSNDAAAIATYEAAMPGYEILGYDGSWLTDDAIHCRAMGVTDRYMLYIDHIPLLDTASSSQNYRVEAYIHDYSDAGLKTDSLLVYWKNDGMGSYSSVVMTPSTRAGMYHADIPAQSVGSEVSYYVYAVDYSGRREAHPYIAPGDAHVFEVLVDTEAPAITHAQLADTPTASWPPTASATVTDNIQVGAVILESWINSVRQVDVAMTNIGGTFTYEGDFPGSVVEGDLVEYRIRAEDAASPANVTYDPTSGYHSFDIVDAIPILIVELDGSPISGSAMTTILDSKDISYYYTTSWQSDMVSYEAVFILLGVYSQNYSLSTTQANELVAYLNAGGQVYMEGGDCWAYDSARTVYNGYFGVDGTSDGSGDLSTVSGVPGTMCDGMSFAYAGGNSYIDHMAPTGGGVVVFRNPADLQGCGVANDETSYRTIGCSFEFGGLTDGTAPSTKADVLTEILDFFELIDTGVDGPFDGARFTLEQNRPNPFNPTTTIAFELPTRGEAELAVYNAAGRRVVTLESGVLDAGRHTATWNGKNADGETVASGIYFFRLTRDGESTNRKAVLLK